MSRTGGRATAIMTVLLATTCTTAGTVSFTAQSPTTVPVGTPISYAIDIQANGSFDFTNVLIGSSDGAAYGFATDPAWDTAFFGTSSVTFDEPGIFASNVFLSGQSSSPVGPSLAAGILSIDTGSMTPGTYVVAVSESDSFSILLGEGGNAETLSGAATYVLTPEPATLTLLALGAIAVRRRR